MSWSKDDRGVKRRAEDDLENEQRLTKRFNLLNLEHNGRLWINPNDTINPPNHDIATSTNGNRSNDEYMEVEETKDKIYIHNLDAELADTEDKPEEERLIFIPDIERRFSRLPKHVLRSGDVLETPYPMYEQPSGGELILYTTPQSLTTAPEHDSVRRAILESRARSILQQEAARTKNNDSDSQIARQGREGHEHNDNEGEEAMEIG